MLKNLPAPNDIKGRLSDGMCVVDWEQICLAWETWHQPENYNEQDVMDVEEFCQVLLSPYGLWDNVNKQPDMPNIRNFYLERC